jgi:hemerythrin
VLVWSPEYEIGIPRIDRQHEAFVELVNDFESARLRKARKSELLGILNEIALFARFHFRSEENLMEAIGYPGLDEHKAQHSRGVDALSNLILSLTLDTRSPEEVVGVLRDWFFVHTSTDDRKIGDFVKQRG